MAAAERVQLAVGDDGAAVVIHERGPHRAGAARQAREVRRRRVEPLVQRLASHPCGQ